MTDARLTLFGLNHRTAPVQVRERLAFTDDEQSEALTALSQLGDEACILSTCNRTELYLVSDLAHPESALVEFLAVSHEVQPFEVRQHSYSLDEEEAVHNLLRVASGLDSMVLGEAQILGQVRSAFQAATEAGTVGRILGRALPLAIEVARRVRTETHIGRGSLSPSSAAVELARSALGDLHERSVLVIGAGDAGKATARSLVDAGVGRIVVANRSLSSAQEVAADVGGNAVLNTELLAAMEASDIVISCTGAADHIVSLDDIHRVMERRAHRLLFCVDIAVPRDFDPAIAQIPNVHLYNIDDLRSISAAHLLDRQREAEAAEAIVEDGLEDYRAWRAAQGLVPIIGALYERADAIRRTEVERTMRRLQSLSPDQRDMIDAMTASIVRRLLHDPVSALKARRSGMDSPELARLVQELFALPNEPLEAHGQPVL
jgi:glutamyl-tRNA reductase